MKAFTDISQSKILAEILPIESADLWYAEIYEGKIEGYNYIVSDTPYYSTSFTKPSENNYSQNTVKDIPCWSLAALLEVLPEGVIENYYAPYLQKENGKYSIAYGNEELLCTADNPVDACVEMIVKLKENKKL